MKKIVSILLSLMAGTVLFAGPADPSPHDYTQPDGSVVRYYMHGDEYLHWMTDGSGACIEIGEDGYVHPAQVPSEARFNAAARRRAGQTRFRMAENRGLTGEHHFCVILVDFADVKFTKTQEQFESFFNGTGTSSGSTGSVKEYWTDQSDGMFIPTFDVYGSYTVSKNISEFINDSDGLLREVINIADEEIYFQNYKHTSSVESVIMVFAGHSAAMGAPNSIWPHQGGISNLSADGVAIKSYCCAPELQGDSGTTIAGIGHVCHEFGHCLGLPDIYDTQRSSHSGNAKAPVYWYSVMDHGNYSNYSKTPPPLSMLEKYLCGWVDFNDNEVVESVTSSGVKTLKEIGQKSGLRALRINTDRDGEFFLCEFRSINPSVNKWGASLPKGGMIVYHVDRSSGHWTSDDAVSMNTDPDHPNLYLVNASDPDAITLYANAKNADWPSYPFPGSRNVSSFNPHSWSGTDTYVSLTGMPNIGATSANKSISVRAHVRTFPLINNSKKGVYNAEDIFVLKLSPGYHQEDGLSVSAWRFDGQSASDSVNLTSGTHTIEADLSDGRKLRLEISVK